MKATINHLIVDYHYQAIDKDFDIYQISTSKDYIDRGSYFLDKPNLSLKAKALTFDRGRSAFVLFEKGTINTRRELIDALENETLSCEKKNPSDLKDYILFRLFLCALSNSRNGYNNLTGKLFFYRPEWIAKNKKTIKALQIDVDQEMNLSSSATTFTRTSSFKDQKNIIGLPLYTFSFDNYSFKRVLSSDSESLVYVRKSYNGTKTEMPFLQLVDDKIENTRVGCLFNTISLLRENYSNYLNMEFEKEELLDRICGGPDSRFLNHIGDFFIGHTFNFVNYDIDIEDEIYFDKLVDGISKMVPLSNITINNIINPNAINFVFLHDEDYYTENKYSDPYKKLDKKHCVIQCVTKEESGKMLLSGSDALINTILKEALIKEDIIKRGYSSLDIWKERNYKDDWFFGLENEGKHFFAIIHPNGQIEFEEKQPMLSGFKNPGLYKLSSILGVSNGKGKMIIADSNGNVMLISRTNRFMLPNEDIMNVDKLSRSKEFKDTYLVGVVDACMYHFDNCSFYSVGNIGYGMQSGIPKANRLYRAEVIEGYDVLNDFISLMAVTFVRYNEFTVVPYPFKYLREYIEMNTNESKK